MNDNPAVGKNGETPPGRLGQIALEKIGATAERADVGEFGGDGIDVDRIRGRTDLHGVAAAEADLPAGGVEENEIATGATGAISGFGFGEVELMEMAGG